jgi:hypothetical protein
MPSEKTYRENRIALPATTPTRYSEGNTNPNYFILVNNSATTVYVGISPLVSSSSFEMIVPPYGTRTYARPDAPQELWLYATGDTSLFIASMERDFEPGMIAQTQEIAANPASGLLGVLDVRQLINALPAGTNVIGHVIVDTLPALAAGANLIGSVITDAVKPATTPAVYNVVMTNADTEYSQLLPANTKKFRLSMVENDTAYRVAYVTGKVATPTAPYISKIIGSEIKEDGLNLASQTIYFACGSAGKTIQIEAWT